MVEANDSAAVAALIRALDGDVDGNGRFNLFVDDVIDVQDLDAVAPFVFQSCQPAP